MQRSLVWVVVALGSIWGAVIIISLAGGDVVYGLDEDTFPLVPLITWIWGALATGFALKAMVMRRPTALDQRHAWVGVAVASLIIWAAVTIVALAVPEFTFEIGTDPILIPLAAVVAPAAGVVATAITMEYVPALTDVAYTRIEG